MDTRTPASVVCSYAPHHQEPVLCLSSLNHIHGSTFLVSAGADNGVVSVDVRALPSSSASVVGETFSSSLTTSLCPHPCVPLVAATQHGHQTKVYSADLATQAVARSPRLKLPVTSAAWAPGRDSQGETTGQHLLVTAGWDRVLTVWA
ncbi:hypothetical protein KIPB_013151, partial [Kipferlia bialata]|eukprot:g13151.t1